MPQLKHTSYVVFSCSGLFSALLDAVLVLYLSDRVGIEGGSLLKSVGKWVSDEIDHLSLVLHTTIGEHHSVGSETG